MKLLFLLLLTLTTTSAFAASLLTPNPPIQLTTTKGRFDFIKVDPTRRRLLACHTGNGTLDVISLDSGTLLASVPTGNAQGVAIDDKGGRYFVSCSKPPQLTIVDATKLAVTGTVPLPEAADVCAYSSVLNRVAVDDDEKPQQWFIDPDAKTVENTVTYGGSGMEDLAFDSADLLVQNLKGSNQLCTLDYHHYRILQKGGAGNLISGIFPTAPASAPHGLAMTAGDNVLIAGGNGKLVLFDFTKEKVISSCDIAPHVDEIAFDPANGRVYCASGTGVISIASLNGTTLTTQGNIPSAQGCHSIAVDPKTHTVWTAFVQGTTPCVQSFTAK